MLLWDKVRLASNQIRSFNFLKEKVMSILPFREGYFLIIWARRHTCLSLTDWLVLFLSCPTMCYDGS